MLKKVSVILIVYLMMISGASINVSALDSNGFTYTLENDEATIISYKSNENIDTLNVPDQIDGHKVTKISVNFKATSNSYDSYEINSLILPNTITDILPPDESNYDSTHYLFNKINYIKFEGVNNSFYIDNDCIYSKDKSNLYFIPTGLDTLKIPSETKNVNFYNLKNTHLTNLTIPSNIEKIYGHVSIPDSLETLDINMNINLLIQSKYLSRLTFGENVTDLSQVEINCDNLSQLTLPDSLIKMPKSIESKKLKQINIPKNVDTLGSIYAYNLEEFLVDPANKYFKSVDGVLFSEDTLLEYPYNSKLKNFKVPEGIKKIKKLGNSNLKSVKLPDSLEEIDSYALSHSSNLDTLNIPKNMSVLEDNEPALDKLLSYCNEIKNITVDPDNKYYMIVDDAVYSKDYKKLYKYFNYNEKMPLINDKTTKIGYKAFDSKKNIESINLKNVTTIEYGAFSECRNLKNIDFGNVETIDGYAFGDCSLVQNIELPESLQSIGGDDGMTFANCTSLESINIPSKVESLCEDYANVFTNCKNLTDITVSKGNQKYIIENNALYTKNHKKLVRVLDKNLVSFKTEDKTEVVSSEAFAVCSKLKSINLNNVIELNRKALNYCNSVTALNLGKITNLTLAVFNDCVDLKSVIIPKTVTYVTAYDRENLNCALYVYPNSKALKSIEQWNSYEWNEHIDYTVINSFADLITSVEVDLLSQNSGSSLKVQQLTSGNSYDEIAKYSDNFNLYDISFYKDNEKVNIDGSAIVRIPVKEGMDGNKCKVYYNDNGQFTDMNAVYRDSYMEFETTHFSEYVLVEGALPTLAMGDVNGDGKVNYLDAIMVLRHDANIVELDDGQLKVAEVNGDGKVNYLDAIMILRYEAGIINSFN